MLTLKKTLIATIALLTDVAIAAPNAVPDGGDIKQDLQAVGHDMKNETVSTYHKAENGTKDVFEKVKDGAEGVLHGIESAFTDSDGGAPWPVKHGEQSCTAKQHGIGFNSYSVNVGADFDVERCHCPYHYLTLHVNTFAFWQCVDDGSVPGGVGLFRMWFNMNRNQAKYINEGFTQCFPEINGFNCPDW